METKGTSQNQVSIGPIRLMPGIPRREVFVFLFIAGIASMATFFINLMQPFVFNEMMHIPVEKQGQLAGELLTVQQAVVLVFVSFAGALADRIGRKIMLIIALAGFGLTAFLLPLASSIFALFVIRFFFGIYSSAHTAGGPPKFYDYPDNASRGKFMALVMVFYALLNMILVGVVGSRIPTWLSNAGFSPDRAGTLALWGCAGVCLFAALIAGLFMMRDRPNRKEREQLAKEPFLQVATKQFTELAGAFREVFGYARQNRRFGILLLTSFVVRTDEAVVGSFFALWITVQGAQEGMTTVQSLAVAGTVMFLMRGCALFVPPILGVLLDRFDRLTIYLLSLFMVGLSFICAPLVPSVTGVAIFAFALFIGMTESAQTISQQAYFGQEAPEHLRGTAYGLLAFFGTGSVVIVSLIAGFMFDWMGPTAPFILIGGLHIFFTLVAMAYLQRGRALARAAANQAVGR